MMPVHIELNIFAAAAAAAASAAAALGANPQQAARAVYIAVAALPQACCQPACMHHDMAAGDQGLASDPVRAEGREEQGAPHPFGECGSQEASSLPSTDLGSSASATSDEAEAWALDFEVGAAGPGCEKEIENVNLNPDSALSCSAHIANNLDRNTLGVPDEASECDDSGSDSGPENVEVETENCGQALDGYARPALCGNDCKVQEGGREVRQGAGDLSYNEVAINYITKTTGGLWEWLEAVPPDIKESTVGTVLNAKLIALSANLQAGMRDEELLGGLLYDAIEDQFAMMENFGDRLVMV